MRAFAGLELGRDAIPDDTTILNFRHLLERHELPKSVFAAVSELLEARGALLRGGTIVDATLIAASASRKNEAQKRDPDNTIIEKAQPVVLWHEGRIGVDSKSGLVHTAGAATGILHRQGLHEQSAARMLVPCAATWVMPTTGINRRPKHRLAFSGPKGEAKPVRLTSISRRRRAVAVGIIRGDVLGLAVPGC